MSWKWFAVKSVFRSTTSGRPSPPLTNYDPDATLVEERVVLFRARSAEEALRKAERDAAAYESEPPHTNPYGQTVHVRFLGALDVFELLDDPEPGVEVFSATFVEPKSVSDAAVVNRRLGREERSLKRRTKFLNREFSSRRTLS